MSLRAACIEQAARRPAACSRQLVGGRKSRRRCPGVGRVGAIERATNKATGQAFAQPDVLGGYLFKQAHQHGLIIRALYDTIACWLTRRTGPGHRTFCKQKQEPGVLNHA
ncbi:hypothetical protein [Pseudomonas aeruginosa]|uniref:hypothetical protein n=1 Tax=Pseudomonas aeruginosa TaxID=287 RepID=UPI0015E73E80|nr:hypothetical protein [Pseudomonas aeruginosa]